jgi:UDP:flavonoid glycosyltransferase YjiC (YdhE family)
MRIVFTTWGSLGDLHPYMALALELKRRGHDASIATLGAYRSNVERAGLGFHPLRPDVSADDPNARELVRRVLDARDGPRHLMLDVFAPVIDQTYEDTLAAVKADGGADLLVTHQVPLTGPVVAQITGVRWVSGVLLPMGFLSEYDPPTPPQAPGLQKIASLHPVFARALNGIGRRVSASWVAPVYALRERLGLPQGGNPVFEGQHSAALVLGLFSRLLSEKQPDFPPQTVVTGFPFYDAADQQPAPRELLQFLDAGDPPIVFTLGSSAVWIAEDFYEIAIAAVKALGRRALLLAGEQAAALRVTGLPDSIAAFDYAPHGTVMPRGSVIVHQGGVGTTGQALRAGRPMLIVPFGQDQPDNARRCVRLGVARTITRKAFTQSRVIEELTRLLSDSSYAKTAALVGEKVRAERGTAVACDAIERQMSQGQQVKRA